ncbi:MAG: DUF4336 domain-containing protein [Synechococcales bacterium]|nr:DUF4336 domain-containing protein [Synechococcales bacterium]
MMTQERDRNWRWNFWFTVPLYPYGQRRTLRSEVVKGEVWTFDQLQGIFYVVTPIRMTVVKLIQGGLLVYAPVAPTPECLQLLQELIQQYGNVRYIILPTISGLEHKVFVGPFARHFPNAQVFVAPDQWSFPLRLPLSWLGFPSDRTQELPPESSKAPFGDQFDYAILGPISLGVGSFGEVAFFHRRSRTLLVTDSVLSIPLEPPAIAQLDPYPLLFHAKETAADPVPDSPAMRLKGWQRIVLFAFYFRPSALEILDWQLTWQAAKQAIDRSRQGYFGLYPFQWKSGWQQSFEHLRGQGRLFVAPILRQLILNRAPQTTIAWANQVAAWGFERIIACHMAGAIATKPSEFRVAFSFLEKQPLQSSPSPLPEADFQLLHQIEAELLQWKITPPAQDKI